MNQTTKQLHAALADEHHKHLEVNKVNEQLTLFLDLKQLTAHDLYSTVYQKLAKKKHNVYVDADQFAAVIGQSLPFESLLSLLVAAVEMANHQQPFCLKSKKPTEAKPTHQVKTKNQALLAEVEVLAQAQTFTRKLQNMPSNYLNPTVFVSEIEKLFAPLKNVKVKVLNNKELLNKKMGLICGVAQGSQHGAYIVSLEYQSDANQPKLGLIGKGVCFDTGGYSIKTGGHMRNMKFDMSGAAAVVGAVYALAKNNVKTNVVGVVGLVENLVSLHSYRVDDVLTSYQQTTVEIDNTDAEGRLVLADCLSYAHMDLGAKKLLSIATLTGAIIYALGATYAGGWSKYDQDWSALNNAANYAGEGVWRMPFHHDYLALLKSQIADIKNSVSSPNAGSSRAACFLKEFTGELPYYHVDIAGLDSFTNGVGSGPFVRTLYYLAKHNA